jgi:hypothetical protein
VIGAPKSLVTSPPVVAVLAVTNDGDAVVTIGGNAAV